jgi:hypothetical protein
MYHNIVRKEIRKAFRELEKRDVDAHMERFHEKARLHRFDLELGEAEACGKSQIREEFEHFFTAIPEHDFHLHDIWVKGGPGETHIAVSWTDVSRNAEGTPQFREGMNRVVLKWGKVMEEHISFGKHDGKRH